MSIIYECDGCGEQTKDSRMIKPVEVDVKSDQGGSARTYHCCAGCERTLRRQADPTKWARAPKQAVG